MKYLFSTILVIVFLIFPAIASDEQDQFTLPPVQSLAPSVDPNVGYRIEDLGNEIYVVVGQYDYTCMFAVTEEGVVLFDAPPTMASILQAAISSKTELPVTHVIYSHAHTDHIGAAGLFADAEVYAHENAAALIPYIAGEQPPIPTVTFNDRLDLEIGGLDIVLEYFGPSHDPGTTFISLPQHRVLMVVDIIDGGHVPWFSLNYASHIPGYLDTIERIMARDFDHYVAGHVDRSYTKDELQVTRDYVFAVQAQMNSAFEALDPINYVQGRAGDYANVDTTAESKAYLDAVVERCAKHVIPEWRERLGAVEAFAQNHCEAFLQDEIDRGNVSLKR